ncbi:hypothetical protein [Caproiciproducens sp.]
MTTYTCKCGRTFQKNTEAGTTGFRMPDYGPEHECYGCPFVKMVDVRDPFKNTDSKIAECRGCKEKLFYGTTATCVDSKASTLHVLSLDFDFIQAMADFYSALEGVDPMVHPPQPGMDESHGRLPFSFNFPQNLKGEAAKQKLIEQFFEAVDTGSSYNKMYARKDVSGCAEQYSLYDKIEKAKEEAKAMNSYYAPCGHKFSRSAGGAAEISVEVTGTTAGCFTCPHGLHEPETDEHGPRIMCTCSRKKVIPEDTPITLEEAMASEPAPVGRKYYNFNLVYFVDHREDNGKYTVFMDDHQHPGPETVTPCATIPDFDTYEQAQNALDGYAIKRGFTDEPTNRAETPIESDLSSDDAPAEAAGEPQDEAAAQLEQDEIDIGPDGMEELAEYQELTRPDTVPADNPEADDAEPPPCDWQNASGADEDEEDSEAPQNNIPAGELVSLRDDAFSTLIDICDSKINQALRTMFELRQTSFSFTAKITFERRGGAFGIKHETGFNFDPIKVKDKGELYDEIPIRLDENGNPIIPYDRQHQLNFDELQPGREIPPSGTATVDGNTGIVEDYQEDEEESEEEPEDPPIGDDITDAVVAADLEEDRDPFFQQLPSCDSYDCPFFAMGDGDDCGCCFDIEDPDSSNFAGDVWEAVHMHGCQRQEVLTAYRRNEPDQDRSEPGDPDDPNILTELDDLPFEMKENSKEDYAS